MTRYATILSTAIVSLSVFAVTALNSCTKSLPAGCYDPVLEAQFKNAPCPMNLDPVKGCDGKTYGNACSAKSYGITSFEHIR